MTSKSTKPTVYAFIDSQNINLGTLNDIKNNNGKVVYKGWRLDFVRFRRFLKDTYHVEQAYLFIGHIPKYQKLYTYLQKAGYILVFKPTVHYYENGRKTTKGNVDAELVLYAAAKEYGNYDKAVLVTGDGDFACLADYLEDEGKLQKLLIPNKYNYSSLLKPYLPKADFISTKKAKLEKNKKLKRRV